MRSALRLQSIVVLCVLATPLASAETPPPDPNSAAPAPVGPDPASTTATYGDWVLRCQTTTAATGPKRLCEVVQTMQLQGHTEPVAQVAFAKGPAAGDLHLAIALPVDISFPSRVGVSLGDKDPQSLDLDWKRCIPGACFADALTGADQVVRWRAATTPGRVRFKDARGRDIALPLSFHGLAPALDALNKGP